MHRWKHFTRIGLALAAFAAVTALVTERQAVAQAIRAALVRNQDEPGRNPYSQHVGCFGLGACGGLTFSPVPAGERLVVTFVNAAIGGGNGSPLLLGGHGSDARYFATDDSTIAVANSPVVAYYEAGETPTLTCSCSSTVFESTLSGYYITLP
jgi:hypothetical protein